MAKARAKDKEWREKSAEDRKDKAKLSGQLFSAEYDLRIAKRERDDVAKKLETAEKEIESWKICNEWSERASKEACRLLRKSKAELTTKTKALDDVKKDVNDVKHELAKEQQRLKNSASFFLRRLDFDKDRVATLQRERESALRDRDELAE